MTSLATICPDASLILDWLLPTPFSSVVDAVWSRWAQEGIDLVGPPLLRAETTSGIRRWVHLGFITLVYGEAAFQRFCQIDLKIMTYPDLHIRAWQLATQFNHPRAYDAQYLAVAEREGCELWTTDHRLFNSVRQALPWVRLVAP